MLRHALWTSLMSVLLLTGCAADLMLGAAYPPEPAPAPVQVRVQYVPVAPPPRVEYIPVAPSRYHVWVPGRWDWRRERREHVWAPGYWHRG
jgi:hypothetical protein